MTQQQQTQLQELVQQFRSTHPQGSRFDPEASRALHQQRGSAPDPQARQQLHEAIRPR